MKVECEGKVYKFEKPIVVYRLLEELSLSKEAHLVVVNNRLVTEDHRLEADDDVKILRVISGG